ncbi:hypothetical protein KFU94_51530 [Chloroflexi bacterium TSY]|nr:hypothetical protein [Chloroflexi bacterium TSY]
MTNETALRFPNAERQLFLDNADVARIENLRQTMHQPSKKGAVIRRAPITRRATEKPGGATYRPQTRSAPAWDPDAQVWKFWTIGDKQHDEAGFSEYHESRDGLHWYQPIVRQVGVQGSWENNAVCVPMGDKRSSEALGVVYDGNDPDPNRRYKAITFTLQPKHAIAFATSPDGIVWSKLDVPLIESGDEPNFSFDARNQLFIATVKVRGPYGRSHALTTSQDFEHWTEPELVFHADEEDQQLAREVIAQRLENPVLQQPVVNHPEGHGVDVYNFAISRYESRYIGFASMFHHVGRTWEGRNHDGFHHVQLASSRDMRHWDRLGNRQPFIDSSPPGAGAYDTLQIPGPSSPVFRDDELWLYYTGIKFRWPPENPDPDCAAICLATLRRDGFVSMDADENGGFVTTQPFHWEGGRLYLNADAGKGEVTCELLDVAGQPMHGFGRDNCVPIAEDNVRLAVNWQGQDGIPEPSGGPIQLRVFLRSARLYSYWFE